MRHLVVTIALVASTTIASAQGRPSDVQTTTSSAVEPLNHVFTYSVLDTDATQGDVLASIQRDVIPSLTAAGAVLYSVWLPTGLTEAELTVAQSTPYAGPLEGLSEGELGLMLAWPTQDDHTAAVDAALKSVPGVATVTSRSLAPIYLAEGLEVPTGAGFYLHRNALYLDDDVAEAVRLSQEAWKTWEPATGARVTGLFRDRPASAGVARLLRIVWYRSFNRWIKTRQTDPSSTALFRARGKLQREGSGKAIATDRLVR